MCVNAVKLVGSHINQLKLPFAEVMGQHISISLNGGAGIGHRFLKLSMFTSPCISAFIHVWRNKTLKAHKGATSCEVQPEHSERTILMIPDKIVRQNIPPGAMILYVILWTDQ